MKTVLYSSLFTISGRQLKHTEMNRETEIRQTTYTKLLQKTYLCTYATFTYISLQVRVIIILQCVSKKTSPTFLAVTRESIVGFS